MRTRLGVVGGGQLAQMFAVAARKLGCFVSVYSDSADCPAALTASEVVVGDYADINAATSWAKTVEVVSYEFENLPVETIRAIESEVKVFPNAHILGITQNRLLEKDAVRRAGFETAAFVPVRSLADVELAFSTLAPAHRDGDVAFVLKTCTMGYDGRGQARPKSLEEAKSAYESLGGGECIAEEWIAFSGEISMLVARDEQGQTSVYGPIWNEHSGGILDVSVCPAPKSWVSDEQLDMAKKIAHGLAESLELVGNLCIELFLANDGRVLVNETAPRPHNSGHLTIEAFDYSQFGQQALICSGRGVAPAVQQEAAAMVNLLGDLWQTKTPQFEKLKAMSQVHTHLYGKEEAKPGRKMGHITVLADSPEKARELALSARESL